ncbi:acyltransferase family protein [Yersinia enterocolitica]
MTDYLQSAVPIKNKVEELESIRGLASILIVIHHIPHWNSIFFDHDIIINGGLMVDLFFVLSGYVIYNAYAEKIKTGKQLLRFQFLRFSRLYPVYILFLLVFVFIEVAKYYAQQRMGIVSPTSQPFRENSITALIQNIFMVQAIGPTGNAVTFNGPSWSISVEFYTYIVFGLIALFCGSKKNIVFFVLFFVSMAILISKVPTGFDSILRCFAGFFLGCMTALLKQRTNIRLPSITPFIAFVAMTLFLSLIMFTVDFGIYPLTAFLIFSLVSSKPSFMNKLLQLKVLTWLGTISYSMYMCHYAIIWFTSQVIRFVFKRPEVTVNGISAPQLTAFEAGLGYVAIISMVLIVSSLVYKYVENPLRLRSRKVVI